MLAWAGGRQLRAGERMGPASRGAAPEGSPHGAELGSQHLPPGSPQGARPFRSTCPPAAGVETVPGLLRGRPRTVESAKHRIGSERNQGRSSCSDRLPLASARAVPLHLPDGIGPPAWHAFLPLPPCVLYREDRADSASAGRRLDHLDLVTVALKGPAVIPAEVVGAELPSLGMLEIVTTRPWGRRSWPCCGRHPCLPRQATQMMGCRVAAPASTVLQATSTSVPGESNGAIPPAY